jgi:putative membrane protein
MENHTSPGKLIQADAPSRLAFDRTRLAYERTMLSWIRTAISLITFGFGVHQFFRVTSVHGPADLHDRIPYAFGTIMVLTGLATLLLASVEHRVAMNALRQAYPDVAGYPPMPRSYARVLAALIGLLGIVALILMQVSA